MSTASTTSAANHLGCQRSGPAGRHRPNPPEPDDPVLYTTPRPHPPVGSRRIVRPNTAASTSTPHRPHRCRGLLTSHRRPIRSAGYGIVPSRRSCFGLCEAGSKLDSVLMKLAPTVRPQRTGWRRSTSDRSERERRKHHLRAAVGQQKPTDVPRCRNEPKIRWAITATCPSPTRIVLNTSTHQPRASTTRPWASWGRDACPRYYLWSRLGRPRRTPPRPTPA